ncbi:MAG: phage/plasmid primase, P4 family [Candidatus Gastranaerophilales bacterium]|nr:phage/plasmid primase, P4 family [Candidatus Gastranaerophilales bacterium]
MTKKKSYNKEERITSPNKTYNLTDNGNAERLIAQYGDNIRYSPEAKKWLIWDGRKWEFDYLGKIESLAKNVIKNIHDESKKLFTSGKSKEGQELQKHALRSENMSSINSMLSLAKSEVTIKHEELDSNIMLLNCLNGTLNLETGELEEHKREDYITKIISVEHDHIAESPLFNKFLDDITSGNKDIKEFLQTAIGYSLTGSCDEQCIFIFYGLGANGKTTFLEVIRKLMGDYAKQTDITTILSNKNASIRNDIARLKGARFVTVTEAECESRISESVIKQMTGKDKVVARFLYQEHFEFAPTHKIFMATNHKPKITGTDEGIWRRIRFVEFNVSIKPEKRDLQMQEKLESELSGILNWALTGLKTWKEKGLSLPPDIEKATNQYRDEQCSVAQFIDECCLIEETKEVTCSDLYSSYKIWCIRSNEKCLPKRTFGSQLKQLGIESHPVGSYRVYKGIKLIQGF